MNTEKINSEMANAFENVSKELLQTVSSFSEKEFNEIPFEGSWTAAQVADHVRKSLKGAFHALNGAVKPTDRKTDEHVENLRLIFLNDEVKMKSPESVLPQEEPIEKAVLYQKLKEVTDNISKATKTKDLSFTCTEFPFPQVGEMTGIEWISFAIFHTQRHNRQMKRIKEHLEAGSEKN